MKVEEKISEAFIVRVLQNIFPIQFGETDHVQRSTMKFKG